MKGKDTTQWTVEWGNIPAYPLSDKYYSW
jgi:hypothetical protein